MKYFISFLLFGLIVIGTVGAGSALDQLRYNFYCKNKLVFLGDYQYEVEKKCGPPASRSAYRKHFVEDVWVYDFHTGVHYILSFREGRLKKILSRRSH